MKVAGAGDVYRFSGGCKILLTRISDGMIFIRGEKQFFCFRNPKRRGKRLEEGRKSRE